MFLKKYFLTFYEPNNNVVLSDQQSKTLRYSVYDNLELKQIITSENTPSVRPFPQTNSRTKQSTLYIFHYFLALTVNGDVEKDIDHYWSSLLFVRGS